MVQTFSIARQCKTEASKVLASIVVPAVPPVVQLTSEEVSEMPDHRPASPCDLLVDSVNSVIAAYETL